MFAAMRVMSSVGMRRNPNEQQRSTPKIMGLTDQIDVVAHDMGDAGQPAQAAPCSRSSKSFSRFGC
jgi:hypothetical protein